MNRIRSIGARAAAQAAQYDAHRVNPTRHSEDPWN